MLPGTGRAKLHGLCSIALGCLCVTMLLVSVPQSTSVVTETAASEELRQIGPGTSLQREIKAGAKDVFGVSASEGTLLRFSIEKGDLALTTVVYGPAGEQIAEHVSEEFEVVELSVPADVSGTYRIEIQSREKGNTARQYELKVASLVPITPANRKDSEALQLMASAGVLRAEWAEASLRKSIEDYDKAAVIWESLNNFDSASQASLKSGDVHFLLGESAEALKQYQSAATLATKGVDHLAEAKALIRLGHLYSYTAQNEPAQTNLNRALDLLGPVDANTSPIIRNAHGEALSNIAEVTYAKGHMYKASKQFEDALKFLQNDRKAEAKVRMFGGYIAGSIGVREKAISEISEALELYQATNDKSGEALALTTLGLSYTSKGQPDEAIDLQNKAIQIFHKIGDRNNEAIANNALGQVYEQLRAYAPALVYYQTALQIFHDTGALDFEIVTIFPVASMHRALGHLDEALKLYERGLQLSRAAGKKRTEANALSEMALVYAQQHRTGETLQLYDELLNFYERINDSRGLAITLNAQGDFFFQIGQKAEAAQSFRRALSLNEKGGDTDIQITTLYNLARAERALSHFDEALSLNQRSLEIIEQRRTDVGSPELRVSYFSGVQKNYDLGVQIRLDLDRARPGHGFAEQALVMSDQGRARLLLDLIKESEADLRKGAPNELLARDRELRGLIQKQSQYLVNLKMSKETVEVKEVEDELLQLNTEYQQVEAQLRDQNPRALALTRFEPISLQEIQNEIGDNNTMLLEFSLGEEASYLFVVTSNSFQYFQLPDRKTLADASIEVNKLATARQRRDPDFDSSTYQRQIEESEKLLRQKSAELSRMLFGPIAAQLRTQRLVLVTEGALQLVPFDALPVPFTEVSSDASPHYLLADHEIDQVPSIATLRVIRASEKKLHDSTDKIAAVIADPVFTRSDDRVKVSSIAPAVASAAVDENRQQSGVRAFENLRGNGLARLTHASEEADAIAAAAPRGTTMVAKGFDATRETAMNSQLGEYQILHFATHGFLDDQHPELSGIVLTMVDKNGVEKNGVMPLHDIYSMELSAELTVLSACQTALGEDIKGEGMVGLTHSFISAGAKSVVASLWKVDDQATAALMKDMYPAMLEQGMTPAAALRAAKLRVMQDKRWAAPYYWAGFIIQGEYTNHITVENNSSRRLGVIVLLSLLVISGGLIVFKVRRRRGAFARRA